MPENNIPGQHKAEEVSLLSSATYDKLKLIALVALPGLGALYVTLSGLWGFPNPEAVAGTIMAIDTFLGLFLKVQGSQFQANRQANAAIEANVVQGVVSSKVVDPDTGIPHLGFTITAPLEEVLESDTVRFKVKNDLPPEHRIPG